MVYQRWETESRLREGNVEPERDLKQCHLFAQQYTSFSPLSASTASEHVGKALQNAIIKSK